MNEDIASAIDDSKYWALVSNMADLNLEDGQIPSREDWKHRYKKCGPTETPWLTSTTHFPTPLRSLNNSNVIYVECNASTNRRSTPT